VTDPVAAADAVVTAADPGLTSPGVDSHDAVLVTGPWLAGTTSLIDALRERMPEHTFVEADELGPARAPLAVVFVASAVAPLTESDCALIDFAANYTDLIIGVVAKIDAHRNWRDVLAAGRAQLAARAPRYQHVQWVGAAAAPDLGEPMLDELVAVLGQRLADPDVQRRNRLRAWEVRLGTMIDRYEAGATGSDRRARVTTLHKSRDDILRERRLSKSERTIALRSQIQQARVQLTYFARNRCTSVRAELQEDASNTTRRKLGRFETYVHTRAGDVVDEVDEGITQHLGDVATELALSAPETPPPPPRPDVSRPPMKSRRLETQLTMVLGAGFGFGVALAVTRLFTPVFFAAMALRYDFIRQLDPGLVAAVIAVAMVSKVCGSALGARLGGLATRDALAIGFGLSSRGAMEIILATLALEAKIIGEPMFVALVLMALTTSIVAGPMIRRLLRGGDGPGALRTAPEAR